ncbi:MAG: hypothetical protein J2P36_01475 [Ktedonobacteraceae bacterium]|nr:hypothetical protein [Ktedonobacteraceae bacterium]
MPTKAPEQRIFSRVLLDPSRPLHCANETKGFILYDNRPACQDAISSILTAQLGTNRQDFGETRSTTAEPEPAQNCTRTSSIFHSTP